MFDRLRNLVIRGAATPPANETANTPLPLSRVTMKKRKRGTSPSKDQDDTDDELLAAKKRKADTLEAAILTPVCDAATGRTSSDVDAARSASSRKRHRDRSGGVDESPSKRMMRDWDDLMARRYLDDGGEDAGAGAEGAAFASRAETASPEAANDVPTASGDDAASKPGTDEGDKEERDVVSDGLEAGPPSSVNSHTPDRPAGLLDAARYQSSTRLRRQAKQYLKQKRTVDTDDDGEDFLAGVDSWAGSSVIPGSIPKNSDDPDAERIALPKRKPRHVSLGSAVFAPVKAKVGRSRVLRARDTKVFIRTEEESVGLSAQCC